MTRTAQRTNDVMKVLTVISALLLPASLIAGIFGMNMLPDLFMHQWFFVRRDRPDGRRERRTADAAPPPRLAVARDRGAQRRAGWPGRPGPGAMLPRMSAVLPAASASAVRPRRRPRHVGRQGRAHRHRRARGGVGVRAGRAHRAAGRRRGAAAGRLVAGRGRRDAATPRPPRRSGRRGRRRLLQHAERGHGAGRRGRRAAHQLHPLDGHARRAAPAPAVRRAAQHAGHQPAAHPALGEAHRRHALADRQGPGGAHALHPRRAAGRVRAHVQVPQRAGLPEPQAHRPHGRELRLDHDQLGDRQPRRGRREVRRRAGARLRHRRRQAAGDREVHRGARPAHAGRGRGAGAGAGDAGRRRRHRHHGRRRRRRHHRRLRRAPVPRHVVVARRARAVQEDRRVREHRVAAVRAARPLAAHRAAGHGRRQPHLAARQRPLPPGRAARRGGAAGRVQDLRPDRGARAARQQRRALHAVDLGRARPGRRRRAPRRPLQPLAREHARGHRARLLRGRRPEHALAARARCASSSAAPSRPSTWSAAAASRTSGARSWRTSSASTVRRVRDPIQANARGAAWIAAAGLGEIAFADVPRLVEFDGEFEPSAAAREVYDARYRTFLEIHKQMRPVYRRINRGGQGRRERTG